MRVDVQFAHNSAAWGAYVVFYPHVRTQTACENSIQLVLRQFNDHATKNITVGANGIYDGLIFLIGSNGLPDREAISVGQPKRVVIKEGK